MYSISPALVSLLFLAYGLSVIFEKGLTRITVPFFALCATTFVWQGTWAVLFQMHNALHIMILVKFGWLLILFLPTTLYHFLAEISERTAELKYVRFSYGVAAVLTLFLIGSDWFIAGYYSYFFGPYPKAGLLHPIHVLQSIIVVNRGLYITYQQQQTETAQKKKNQLRLCVVALLIYFFAAVDYLCNFGFEFYPPGVAFTAVSLGLISWAVLRYDLMSPMALAATMAHEMRTPLMTIRMQALALAQFLPELYRGYQLAVDKGLCQPMLQPGANDILSNLSDDITHEIDCSNIVIDMMLASANMEKLDKSEFAQHSVIACIEEAVQRYPFTPEERTRIRLAELEDFSFSGIDHVFVYVLFNLIKNAVYAMKVAGKGEIVIATNHDHFCNTVRFTDTASGIPQDVLPRIFEQFYSTKRSRSGCAGIGLAFCSQVMGAFGGHIRCESTYGEYTTFILEFPLALKAAT